MLCEGHLVFLPRLSQPVRGAGCPYTASTTVLSRLFSDYTTAVSDRLHARISSRMVRTPRSPRMAFDPAPVTPIALTTGPPWVTAVLCTGA